MSPATLDAWDERTASAALPERAAVRWSKMPRGRLPSPATLASVQAGQHVWLRLLMLVGISAAVQAWLVSRAAVPALDSVNFVSIAQVFGRDGFWTTLESEVAPPLFPFSIHAVHELLAAAGLIADRDWLLPAQIAAAWPLVIVPVLAYALFRHSVEDTAAWLAALLLPVVTVVARLGGDALSDSLHLLLVLGALLSAATYLLRAGDAVPTGYRWLWASGGLVALGMLCRVESLVLVLPIAGAITIEEVRARRPLWQFATPLVVLLSGAIVVLGLYLAAARADSAGEVVARLAGRQGPREEAPLNVGRTQSAVSRTAPKPTWRHADGQPMSFGRKDPTTSQRFRGLGAAAYEMLRELAQSLHYALGLAALAGLWCLRHTIFRPIDRLLILLYVVYILAALAVASRAGYLAGRHLLPLVVVALPWAVAGLFEVPRQLARRLAWPRVGPARRWGNTVGLASWAVAFAACLQTTLAARHEARLPHLAATNWLNSPAARPGAVLDSAGLTALGSGRKTYRYQAAPWALADAELSYLIVEQFELAAPSPRGATLRELTSGYACEAARFQAPGAGAERAVLVFDWKADVFIRSSGDFDAR